jgi:hypothetical protein
VRGISEVQIEGTVTDTWAEYLEMAFGAPVEAKVSEFQLQPKVKDGLDRWKNGFEVKYGY